MSVDPKDHAAEEVMAEGIAMLRDFYYDLGLTASLREIAVSE